MAKRPDANEIAFRVVAQSVGLLPPTEPPTHTNPAAELGRRGGLARARNLSAKKRRAQAKAAAAARWKK